MKKTLHSFLLFLLIGHWAAAQENSLLWKIEGKDLTKPSYLFGTIHATCNNDFELKTKVTDALSKSEKLVLEVNVTDPNEMKSIQKMMVADKTISSQLAENQQKELDSLLVKYINTELKFVDRMSPAMLVSLITLKYFSCDFSKLRMFEMELSQRATQQTIPIEGLETLEQQMQIVAKAISLDEILRELRLFPEAKVLYADLVKAYKTENTAEIDKLLNDEKFMNEAMKAEMLDNRNKSWIAPIEKKMKENTCFFAFGAAHLLGPEGLISLLKEKGYHLTPVF